jgi:hypothetical protein
VLDHPQALANQDSGHRELVAGLNKLYGMYMALAAGDGEQQLELLQQCLDDQREVQVRLTAALKQQQDPAGCGCVATCSIDQRYTDGWCLPYAFRRHARCNIRVTSFVALIMPIMLGSSTEYLRVCGAGPC